MLICIASGLVQKETHLLDPVRLKIPACHPALLHERSLRISHALVHMNNARQVREMNAGCLWLLTRHGSCMHG